ncbi:GFA family protein [Shimia thalassica]|uniref:GFA family protein n=1 Tax=Shimia thalassica TaxID=1715693 RepID=UPI0026E2062C|nr:GFA family protein [Shimia thalassica]MDO6478464.1 GFA family protein [Shimia thalassica]
MSGQDITGRCYCGAVSFTSPTGPLTVAYCHCSDCRRWTGAPAAAFAAFDVKELKTSPTQGQGVSHHPGVTRWNCQNCGSPLMATFDYLPDQVYVPLGLIDQADNLPPRIHCHAESAFSWLHISDDLERAKASGRETLNAAN